MTFSYNLTLTWCFSGPECFINVYNYNGVYQRGLICFGYLVLTILTLLTIFDDFYVFETTNRHRMAISEPILIIEGSFEPSWKTLEEVQKKLKISKKWRFYDVICAKIDVFFRKSATNLLFFVWYWPMRAHLNHLGKLLETQHFFRKMTSLWRH